MINCHFSLNSWYVTCWYHLSFTMPLVNRRFGFGTSVLTTCKYASSNKTSSFLADYCWDLYAKIPQHLLCGDVYCRKTLCANVDKTLHCLLAVMLPCNRLMLIFLWKSRLWTSNIIIIIVDGNTSIQIF